jgi:hypothetical protein
VFGDFHQVVFALSASSPLIVELEGWEEEFETGGVYAA